MGDIVIYLNEEKHSTNESRLTSLELAKLVLFIQNGTQWEIAKEDTSGVQSSYDILVYTWLGVRIVHLWLHYSPLSVLRFRLLNYQKHTQLNQLSEAESVDLILMYGSKDWLAVEGTTYIQGLLQLSNPKIF